MRSWSHGPVLVVQDPFLSGGVHVPTGAGRKYGGIIWGVWGNFVFMLGENTRCFPDVKLWFELRAPIVQEDARKHEKVYTLIVHIS